MLSVKEAFASLRCLGIPDFTSFNAVARIAYCTNNSTLNLVNAKSLKGFQKIRI